MADWLESHWVAPAYSGWLLGGVSIFFFMAATNTMAGWLYVLSGIGLALLAIAAILPERMVRHLQIQRCPIHPVSAGDVLTIEVLIENRSQHSKTLLQVRDLLPHVLGQPVVTSIEQIAPHDSYRWIYTQPTSRRGIYRWQSLQVRTAAPWGLFWCRRSHTVKAIAIVYPTVLPLTQCPLIDEMGRDTSLQLNSDRRSQAATEGLTRSLRPYRWGDATRFVHWRTSARYGELRVRELEVFTGGQELIICLDSAASWRSSTTLAEPPEDFEQAVIAAASLYFYACHCSMSVRLWTAGTGLLQGNQGVLEALAATYPGESIRAESLPTVPLVWLTQNPASLNTLPPGSRWILWTGDQPPEQWQSETKSALLTRSSVGIVIKPESPLQLQLQAALGARG
ncbi:DUF58 domain-containing protein [Pantanalinema rosaneae]|uniref:DUF58 domain-containing protein n=1 Tax=Pantanalinema rosaneae TaxID=1620701 RepID=UPI003D7013E4